MIKIIILGVFEGLIVGGGGGIKINEKKDK